MQRFFVEPYQIEKEAHRIHINGTDVNHIKNVLRMKCGEDVWISDGGDKEYHCQIEELGEDEVLLHILYAQEPEYELPNKLYLFQGLPKADKMELIIQKAVELGAFSVIPNYDGSFKVYTRRAKKSYPITSMEVSAELGGRILDEFPDASVDVHEPDLTLSVEIRDKIYVYSQTIKGAGGMPIGTNGKAMLLSLIHI